MFFRDLRKFNLVKRRYGVLYDNKCSKLFVIVFKL